MKSPAHALANYLAGADVGNFAAATGWSIAVSTEPASPDTTITLYDSPAASGDYFADADISQPMIQVRTRARDYEAAYTKQHEIKAILSSVINLQIDDAYYIGAWLKGDILAIGRDDNDRFLFTANYRVERQAIEEAST